MGKNKRKSDLESADEKKKKDANAGGGKGLRTGVATLTICAAAFGAYYSPHFRTASSGWLERWRALAAKPASTGGFSEKADATADENLRERIAQAPSFRDFLTDEYGEEGARELLSGGEPATDVPTVSSASVGFADYVVAETSGSEAPESAPSAPVFDAASSPAYDASSLPSASSESPSSFADYVAAETNGSESPSSFADYVAEKPVGDLETDADVLNVGKTRLASAVAPEADGVASADERALAARLQNEMAERGVGAPRVERWGGRFWRASGFATTSEGVATFCEAVDLDPTAAQRAALTKFDAARF